MSVWRLVAQLGCLVVGACTSGQPAPTTDRTTIEINEAEKPMTNPIEIRLLTSATTLSMAERSSFQVGIAATNNSPSVVDPELSGARLLVNGTPSPAWDLAMGSGGRSPQWEALPAGKTISAQWPLGPALFPSPGSYVLSLRLGEHETSTVVEVTP